MILSTEIKDSVLDVVYNHKVMIIVHHIVYSYSYATDQLDDMVFRELSGTSLTVLDKIDENY